MDPSTPRRVALLTHDSLGNYVAATPLIALLRANFPAARLEYVGGRRTRGFWEREPGFDAAYLYDDAPSAAYDLVLSTERAPETVAVARRIVAFGGRVVGPGAPEPSGLAADPDWTAPDLRARFPELTTPFIAEVQARAAGLGGEVGRYSLPREDAAPHGCDVLVSCSASLEAKLWPIASWRAALAGIKRVGLVGVKGKPGETYCGQATEDALAASGAVEDLRSAYTLPRLVGAISQARAVLTIDNGIMHVAAATSTPIVALFRPGIRRLWSPPGASLIGLEAEPVAAISVGDVRDALARSLA